MNRRLYFTLPDTKYAHEMMNELLLARVNANRIHFIARPGMHMGNLPKASVSERTDLIEGWELGMVMGALLGLTAGLIAIMIPTWWYTQPLPTMPTLLICTLIGFVVGGLWTALVATTIPNARLKPFEKQIAEGKVLMIALVPFHRVKEVRNRVLSKHPEADYKGAWPTDHVLFP